MFCSGLNSTMRKFLHDVTPEIQEKVNQALHFTGVIRDAVNGGLAVAITDVIPGTWDDNIRAAIGSAATAAIDKLNIISLCVGKETLEEKIQCLLDALAKVTDVSVNSFLIKLASLLVAHLDDNAKKESFYDTITQVAAIK